MDETDSPASTADEPATDGSGDPNQEGGPGGGDPRERYKNMKIIGPGASGPEVTTLQQDLNTVFHHESIFDPHRIGEDGNYGAQTSARVASFQRWATPWFGRIVPDGNCGRQTWKKLGWVLTGMGY